MRNLLLFALFIVGAAYFGSKYYLHYRVESALDNALLMARPFADVEYDNVSSNLQGELSVEGVTVHLDAFREPLTIRRLRLITPGYFFLLNMANFGQPGQDFDIPERFGFAVDGVRASVTSDYVQKFHELGRAQFAAEDADAIAAVCTGKYGFAPETLRALGYSDIDMSLAMSYRQDERHLFLDVSAGLEDMYRIDMTMKMADRLTPESLMSGRYRPRLAEGRIEYLDLSLRERSVELCQQQGLTADEIRTAQLEAFAAAALQNGLEFDEYVIEPYKAFLDGKSTFVMTARPVEPVSLSQISLYKPADVPALLNLEGEVF